MGALEEDTSEIARAVLQTVARFMVAFLAGYLFAKALA